MYENILKNESAMKRTLHKAHRRNFNLFFAQFVTFEILKELSLLIGAHGT